MALELEIRRSEPQAVYRDDGYAGHEGEVSTSKARDTYTRSGEWERIVRRPRLGDIHEGVRAEAKGGRGERIRR